MVVGSSVFGVLWFWIVLFEGLGWRVGGGLFMFDC